MKRNGTVSYSHVFVSRRSVECQLVKTLPSFFIMFGLIWIFSWSCLNRNHMIILYVCEFCFCFFIYLIVQFCNFLDCHGFGLLSMPSHAHFSSRIKSIKKNYDWYVCPVLLEVSIKSFSGNLADRQPHLGMDPFPENSYLAAYGACCICLPLSFC